VLVKASDLRAERHVRLSHDRTVDPRSEICDRDVPDKDKVTLRTMEILPFPVFEVRERTWTVCLYFQGPFGVVVVVVIVLDVVIVAADQAAAVIRSPLGVTRNLPRRKLRVQSPQA
jgi:hypothetical protein